jgi:hypothetical protein
VVGDLLTGRGVARLGDHAHARHDAADHQLDARDDGRGNGAIHADDHHSELLTHFRLSEVFDP